jgi:hypothetical protein
MKKKMIISLCVLALLTSFLPAQTQSSQPTSKPVIIPEGTVIQLKIHEPISSKLSDVGDEVITSVKKDVEVDGVVLLPAGTEVIGRITAAKNAKRPFKGGQLHISFDRVRFDNGSIKKIAAIVQSATDFSRDEKIKSNSEGTLKGTKSGGETLRGASTAIGISSTVATIILLSGRDSGFSGFGGGISGGTAAAAAGVLGAGVITGFLLTRGKEVRLDTGAIVRLRLERALSVE